MVHGKGGTPWPSSAGLPASRAERGRGNHSQLMEKDRNPCWEGTHRTLVQRGRCHEEHLYDEHVWAEM